MKYGYARVSTKDQNLDMQIDALEQYGCQKIFSEHAKGAKADRPQWLELLNQIKSGDSLIIWKLDRVGRSLSNLISIVNKLIKKNISIISLNDPIDTSSIQGKFMFNIFASLAEFEKDLISSHHACLIFLVVNDRQPLQEICDIIKKKNQ